MDFISLLELKRDELKKWGETETNDTSQHIIPADYFTIPLEYNEKLSIST